MTTQITSWQQRSISFIVNRISFDFLLCFDFTQDSTGFMVRIECPFTLILANDERILYAPPHYVNSDPLLALLHQTITSALIDEASGELTIVFSNRSTLSVCANDRYEAWEIVGDDGLRIICLPSGSLAVWNANT